MTLSPKEKSAESTPPWHKPKSDTPFYVGLAILSLFYIVLIAAMLGADVFFAFKEWQKAVGVLMTDEIRYAVWLSLISCCITTILSLWVAVPIGYLMSRVKFPDNKITHKLLNVGKTLVDAILDIPIFLPPLVIGLSLLILFRQTPLKYVDDFVGIALHVPAVILAQFAVASAFAVRTLRATFDEISPRREQVAMTLGCSRSQAFWMVVLPEARRGLLTAATMAWARSLGEFGPILVFAGSTRQKTEVLPVSVHLELSIGNIEGAVGVSLLMVFIAVFVLMLVRVLGGGNGHAFRGFGR